MSDKKYCPIASITESGWIPCAVNCALWDEERQCCGLKQAPAVHHHYHTHLPTPEPIDTSRPTCAPNNNMNTKVPEGERPPWLKGTIC